jgi:hypothetical protein
MRFADHANHGTLAVGDDGKADRSAENPVDVRHGQRIRDLAKRRFGTRGDDDMGDLMISEIDHPELGAGPQQKLDTSAASMTATSLALASLHNTAGACATVATTSASLSVTDTVTKAGSERPPAVPGELPLFDGLDRMA